MTWIVERTPALSGALFLPRGSWLLAITFGYGRHLTARTALEADFGLKVAAGLTDPEEIAVLDARSVEATSIQVRSQSSRGVTAAAIGFNVSREMLRAIAGPIAEEDLGSRIVGADGLALTARLQAPELGPRLDRIKRADDDGPYVANFAHIDRWSEVPPGAKRAELDDALVAALERRWERLAAGEDPDALPGGAGRPPTLEAPEVLGWELAGFRSTSEDETALHAFPSLDAYLEALNAPPTLPQLRRGHHLAVVSDIDGAVVNRWPIHGHCYGSSKRMRKRMYWPKGGGGRSTPTTVGESIKRWPKSQRQRCRIQTSTQGARRGAEDGRPDAMLSARPACSRWTTQSGDSCTNVVVEQAGRFGHQAIAKCRHRGVLFETDHAFG